MTEINPERMAAIEEAFRLRAGRFVFLYGEGDDFGYVTSWDTWEQAESAWNAGNGTIPAGYKLVDDETGRTWLPGARYEWEDAST